MKSNVAVAATLAAAPVAVMQFGSYNKVANAEKEEVISNRHASRWRLVFQLWHHDRIIPSWHPCLFVAVATAGWVVFHTFQTSLNGISVVDGFAGITFVVSLLISFRVKEAYSHWYEARMQWGKLVSEMSNFSQMVHAFAGNSDASLLEWRDATLSLACAYPFILKNFLRGVSATCDSDDLACLLPDNPMVKPILGCGGGHDGLGHLNPEMRHRNLTLLMRHHIAGCVHNGALIIARETLLEESVQRMVSVSGTCSRIKSTPLLYGLAIHFRTMLVIYLCMLPLIFLSKGISVGAMIALMITRCFAFLTLDEVAVECENPFAKSRTGRPTDCGAVCRNVQPDGTLHADGSSHGCRRIRRFGDSLR